MNQQVLNVLNQQVANYFVLYMKLHNFHWFIKGPHFYQLHGLFETLYDEATKNLDALAERMLMLEGRPVATLKECLDLSTIKEASSNETEQQMIEMIIEDFQMISRELAKGIKFASEIGDDVTVDMFVGIKSNLDKHNWMLTSLIK